MRSFVRQIFISERRHSKTSCSCMRDVGDFNADKSNTSKKKSSYGKNRRNSQRATPGNRGERRKKGNKLLWTLRVVMMAPIIGNQSERSIFGLDQSESRISPM